MFALPFFFQDENFQKEDNIILSVDTMKHVIQVLRMRVGEKLVLCNGRGSAATSQIIEVTKKHCKVNVLDVHKQDLNKHGLHLYVAFTKNSSRNEWLLEKAVELGVKSITALITDHSERDKYKKERWEQIIISAMLQSQQLYLPQFEPPIALKKCLSAIPSEHIKLIAHCNENFIKTHISSIDITQKNVSIFIGPEGDFSNNEILLLLENNFLGVNLCLQRLRTETAAIAVCSHYNLSQKNEIEKYQI